MVHHIIMLRHKKLEFFAAFVLRPGCFLVQRVYLFILTDLFIIKSDLVELFEGRIVRDERSEPPVMVRVFTFKVIHVEFGLDLIWQTVEPLLMSEQPLFVKIWNI